MYRTGIITLITLIVSACGPTPMPPTVSPEIFDSTDNPPVPSIEVSPTITEAAAIINGEPIIMDAYQANLARFDAAMTEVGTILAPNDSNLRVLDDLIHRQLLSQAARQAGFEADIDMVEQRLAQLTEQAGGADSFSAWLSANFYSADTFPGELALDIEAAWMRDQIISEVSKTAEQILARQVLFYTSFQAERAYAQLENGAAFDVIVLNNDPQELGYLGWFPRNYLLDPELEQAAFALQPGQYSHVIETRLGFHILEILDYDPDRELSQDALRVFQSLHLQQWLEQIRLQSQIEIFVP